MTIYGKPPEPGSNVARWEEELRALAMAYPETTEDHPWDHSAFKVRGKTFLFLVAEEGRLCLSLKLPVTGKSALDLPFTSPTGYGLGKSGWVSAEFTEDADLPQDLLREWLDESYRAIAPKRLAALLGR